MYHVLMPFPSFAILRGDFGTKPIEKEHKKTKCKRIRNQSKQQQNIKSRENLSFLTKERERERERTAIKP